jgi:vesicle coat complex subunit
MFMPHIAYELSLQYYSSNAPIAYRSLLWHRAQQGKVAELRAELLQPATKKDKNFLGKKIALKKIVANMTMSNNDMVALFPDIIGCMAIESLEIKKMWVGQYIILLAVFLSSVVAIRS